MIIKALLLLLAATLACHASVVHHDIVSRLHRAYSSSNRTNILRGRALVNTHSVNTSASPSRRVMHFAAHLKRDVVLYDELEQDFIRITRCSASPGIREASVTLQGSNLQPNDFEVGAAFIIHRRDWELHCAPMRNVTGIDHNDDVLFFVIDNIDLADNQAILYMTMTPGAEVVPYVDFDIAENVSWDIPFPKRIVFDDEPFHESPSSLNPVSRKTRKTKIVIGYQPQVFRGYKTIHPTHGLDIKFGVSMKIDMYRLQVSRETNRVRWNQHLEADMTVELNSSSSSDIDQKGVILYERKENFGKVQDLPLVGRVGYGAFGRVAWMVNGKIGAGLKTRFTTSQSFSHEVQVQLDPSSIHISGWPPNPFNVEYSSLDFTEVPNAEVGFSGFVGMRPTVALEYRWKGFDFMADTGADVGLQSETLAKSPPFGPFFDRGLKIGDCNTCHKLRGSASIRAKDLVLRLWPAYEPPLEHRLIPQPHDIELGTICALPDSTCGGFASPCLDCWTACSCPQNYDCIDGKCMLGREFGETCGPCGPCKTGTCVGGVCLLTAVTGTNGNAPWLELDPSAVNGL